MKWAEANPSLLQPPISKPGYFLAQPPPAHRTLAARIYSPTEIGLGPLPEADFLYVLCMFSHCGSMLQSCSRTRFRAWLSASLSAPLSPPRGGTGKKARER